MHEYVLRKKLNIYITIIFYEKKPLILGDKILMCPLFTSRANFMGKLSTIYMIYIGC